MKNMAKVCSAIVLALAFLSQSTLGVYAARKSTEYVSEVFLSYGNTDMEAKKYLTDNGYRYVDCNLNEGADDAVFLSKSRAVYMGYKTTTDPEKAITDMKLMNMNGGYSVQDYQIILQEQKSNIQVFINQFITALGEYRANYINGRPRAKAAYKMLNIMKDDDTGLSLGDLFLNKIKEEYKIAEYNELSAEEQKQHADMTTILMQGNATLVLYIEQILATAVDTDDLPWIDRFAAGPDYDTMLETVMEDENVDPGKAEKLLSAKYDEDAKIIGSKVESYCEWLSDYISLVDDGLIEDELTDCFNGLSDAEKVLLSAKGAQYEILNGISYDDETTLLELLLDDSYDFLGEDAYLLYPVVRSLSDGQRACLDFLSGYEFFAMGCNTESVVNDLIEQYDFNVKSEDVVSVYSGVDRSIYGNEVALTGEAYKLQTSDDKDYSTNWFSDGISNVTLILGALSIVTIGATVGAFVARAAFSSRYDTSAAKLSEIADEYLYDYIKNNGPDPQVLLKQNFPDEIQFTNDSFYWSNVFSKVGFCLTVVSIILSGVTLWYAYEDLKAYYNTDFTPIPMWMVDQGADETNAKIFTYYKVVNCNRVEGNFSADNTKLLNNFGDINGDVGKQWLALYTTTDKSAGNPIVAEFKTQTGKSTLPGEYTALSIFCNKSAQNLTDAKSGFTYNDELNGIYLFFNTDTSVFAGSTITTGVWAAAAGGIFVLSAIAFIIIRSKKKTAKTQNS